MVNNIKIINELLEILELTDIKKIKEQIHNLTFKLAEQK